MKTKVDYSKIEHYVQANLSKKPDMVAVDRDEWEDALMGYYATFLQSYVGDEFKGTEEAWTWIYFSAMAFCRGMEYAEVKSGTRTESLYPRY